MKTILMQKNTTTEKLILISVSLALLILPTILQMHMKKMPQIIMLIFGAATIISLFIHKQNLTLILFYIVLGGALFINFGQITFHIIKLTNINASMFSNCDGCTSAYGGMILGNYISGILTPLTLFLVHKKSPKTSNFKYYFSTIYFFTVGLVYLVCEVL